MWTLLNTYKYKLYNCQRLINIKCDFTAYLFCQVKETFPGISTSDVDKRKDQHFIKWLKNQVLTQTLNFFRSIKLFFHT